MRKSSVEDPLFPVPEYIDRYQLHPNDLAALAASLQKLTKLSLIASGINDEGLEVMAIQAK